MTLLNLPAKITKQKRPNGTLDVGIDCSEEQITDQSYKQASDINNIMKQYEKTGMLPYQTTIPGTYTDNSLIPDLETAFEIANRALDAFDSLPPEVRRLMDNDPTQLESFIQNDENIAILKKHGIIVDRPQPEPTLKDVIQTLKETKQPTEKV